MEPTRSNVTAADVEREKPPAGSIRRDARRRLAARLSGLRHDARHLVPERPQAGRSDRHRRRAARAWKSTSISVVARYDLGLSKFETRWGTFTDPWTHQPQPKCGFVVVGTAKGRSAVMTTSRRSRCRMPPIPKGDEFASTRFRQKSRIPSPISSTVSRNRGRFVEPCQSRLDASASRLSIPHSKVRGRSGRSDSSSDDHRSSRHQNSTNVDRNTPSRSSGR